MRLGLLTRRAFSPGAETADASDLANTFQFKAKANTFMKRASKLSEEAKNKIIDLFKTQNASRLMENKKKPILQNLRQRSDPEKQLRPMLTIKPLSKLANLKRAISPDASRVAQLLDVNCQTNLPTIRDKKQDLKLFFGAPSKKINSRYGNDHCSNKIVPTCKKSTFSILNISC